MIEISATRGNRTQILKKKVLQVSGLLPNQHMICFFNKMCFIHHIEDNLLTFTSIFHRYHKTKIRTLHEYDYMTRECLLNEDFNFKSTESYAA